MEKRIELEKRGRAANQITELILDNCRSTNIVGLTDDFTALETLSLINVGLTTLKGFPTLPALKKLELSDNRISAGLGHLANSPKLTHLNLSGNKIKDLEELKALTQFQSLLVLDLFNNEATAIDSYREKIFALIPSLKYLDGFDANDDEALSDGEEDELNGNDSEEDEEDEAAQSGAFSINGLEFDLAELEVFERKLEAKRAAQQAAKSVEPGASNGGAAVDELDEYLDRLAIDVQHKQPQLEQPRPQRDEPATASAATAIVESESAAAVAAATEPVALPVLLYFALGLLFFVSTVRQQGGEPQPPAPIYKSNSGESEQLDGALAGDNDDDEDEDDEDGGEDGEDGEEEDGDGVSLSDVYNDNLEEDNSDYVEEEEEDDDDEESDDEESGAVRPARAADAEAAEENGSAGEEEEEEADEEEAADEDEDNAEVAEPDSPARGKKRKHDG